jgi:L-ascorbate metabolism protein UlaG (beta-lactamase superfamily)
MARIAGTMLLLAALSIAGAGWADEGGHRADASLVAARQKFFGTENVDAATGVVRKDRVVFSWVTNSTYATSVAGRILLLDSFVTRLEVTPGRTPIVIQDLVDLHPEAILLGHGHFDHADNAAYLAKLTGATIVATPETCDAMQADATRMFGAGTTVPCLAAVSRGSAPGAEVNTLGLLEPEATVTVFKHLHSTLVPTDPTVPLVHIDNIADPRDATLFPAGTPLTTVLDTRTSTGTGGPLSLFFHFRLAEAPHFSFAWHNTTGALREGCAIDGCFGPAVGQRLGEIMQALPGGTDVEIGSVVSLGFTTNGERDIVDYIGHVRPKVFIPAHLTAVARESSSLEWKLGFLKELDAMSVPADRRPELLWIVDPNDYLRPFSFDAKSRRWDKGRNR